MATIDSSVEEVMKISALTGNFEQDVLELYRAISTGLEPGLLRLTVSGEEDIALTPKNSRSAPIRVHLSDRTARMVLGRHCTTEVFATYRAEGKALERIGCISKAVITGAFSEDVWLLDGRIVKSVGKLVINGKTSTLRYWGLFNPLRAKEKQHYDYEPYAGTS